MHSNSFLVEADCSLFPKANKDLLLANYLPQIKIHLFVRSFVRSLVRLVCWFDASQRSAEGEIICVEIDEKTDEILFL